MSAWRVASLVGRRWSRAAAAAASSSASTALPQQHHQQQYLCFLVQPASSATSVPPSTRSPRRPHRVPKVHPQRARSPRPLGRAAYPLLPARVSMRTAPPPSSSHSLHQLLLQVPPPGSVLTVNYLTVSDTFPPWRCQETRCVPWSVTRTGLEGGARVTGIWLLGATADSR